MELLKITMAYVSLRHTSHKYVIHITVTTKMKDFV